MNVDVKRKSKTAWTGPNTRNPYEQTLTMMGQEIPKIGAQHSYVYLGVHVFLSMQWRTNVNSMLDKVLTKLKGIETMTQDPALVLRTAEMVIRPTVRYMMPMATPGWHDVQTLNTKFFNTVKHIVGLRKYTPNMHVMRPRKELGMAVDPLHLTLTDTLRQIAEHLRNIPEDICRMWRGLWHCHKHGIASTRKIPQPNITRTAYPVLNMMAQVADIGVTWTNDEVVTASLAGCNMHEIMAANN